MKKNLLSWLAILILCAAPTMGGGLSDNFDTPRDYLTEGVSGTIWDGLVGLGMYESVEVMDASITTSGVLRLESAYGNWGDFPPNASLGPFLYRAVEGDFVATVYIAGYAGTPDVWVYNNAGGLMARVANLDFAGAGEDFVADTYMPIYDVGNKIDNTNDGIRAEFFIVWNAWEAGRWLQLERKGNNFYVRYSTNGTTWVTMQDAPVSRSDMDSLPVQVGLWQATYSTGELGYVEFDNFTLKTAVAKVSGTPVVKEQGETTGNVTVSLADLGGAPTDDVVVTATPYVISDPNDPNDISMVTGPVIFQPSDWENPQTITVAAIDDELAEGPEQAGLSFAVTSADPRYDGGLISPAMVRVVDNDAPDLDMTLSGDSIWVSEAGDTDQVTIVLTVPITPTNAEVTVDLSSPLGQLSFNPAQITFDSGNYNIAQPVEISAVDDTNLEWDPHGGTISFDVGSSGTGNYNNLPVPDMPVTIGENECGAWGYLELDTNKDCVIDILDMAEFVEIWIACTVPYEEGCQDIR